jgi:ABC-type branched-subunit amino acid transport system substrate-binding protein
MSDSTRRSFVRGIGAAATLTVATPLLGAGSSTELTRIARLLRVDPTFGGRGLSLDVGAVWPLTGPGAIGAQQIDVAKLAFRHVAALGGPAFRLRLEDNRSGDPRSGADAVRALGSAKVPMMLSSFAGDFGSELAGIAEYRILSLDGSGGTSDFAQHKPYFWGSIAITPDDAFPGAVSYVRRTMPHVKKVAFLSWDIGRRSDAIFENLRAWLKPSGWVEVANERTAIGETDYSWAIEKFTKAKPDIIFLGIYAQDVGYFLRQYTTGSLKAPVFAFTHTDAAANTAGSAYEGLYVAFDYFDAGRPQNPWAAFFVNELTKRAPHVRPDYYAANAYEDVFVLWECVRRVLATRGNPKDGAQLNAAFERNLTFPSLYGGGPDTAGTIVFDAATHSVKRRPMVVGKYESGRIAPLAFFDAGGGNFRLASNAPAARHGRHGARPSK